MLNRIEEKVIETIRFLAVDAVEKANSGHPGMPMGAAAMAWTLWSRFLKGSATDPQWVDRDRFVLSAGHGSMLQYALLHLFGYAVTLEDLRQFRQLDSLTPGHPEHGETPGVEATTGPLGQGFANSVGMAVAERRLAAEFNTADFDLVNHYTYVLVGDGCLMEGVSQEAASLAGTLKLGKLIALYDSNRITIDGSTDLAFTEDVGKRFEAYGWEVYRIHEGNDLAGIDAAIQKARLDMTKPSLIIVNTTIAYGSPNKGGHASAHGMPLGAEEVLLTKKQFGWEDSPPFHVPVEVLDHMTGIIDQREIERFMWEEKFEDYREKYPEKAARWIQWHDFESPVFEEEGTALWNRFKNPEATRSAGAIAMNALLEQAPNLVGGSADLVGSTKTWLEGKGVFSWENPRGSNIYFGVREHAMGAILNGMALHGGLRVFGSTFLTFSDYMKPAIRLSALMKLPVVYVFTHDSIGLGEDGPTHQPVEHLWMLRGIPNLAVFRPADAKETAIAWQEIIKRTEGPSALVLSRQNLPILEGVTKGAHYGGYILNSEIGDRPRAVLMGTGSEVSVLLEAQGLLREEGIDTRVVSMPCLESFDSQPEGYRQEILPPGIPRLSLEAGSTQGWYKYVLDGKPLGMDTFGASAPAEVLFKRFGFTADRVAEKVRELLSIG